MKRRKPPNDPHPNPWRWALGGPITDFGEQGIEAGPSRVPWAGSGSGSGITSSSSAVSACAACEIEHEQGHAAAYPRQHDGYTYVEAQIPHACQPQLERKRRPRRSRHGRHLPFLALATTLALPLAAAGPLPPPPPPSPPLPGGLYNEPPPATPYLANPGPNPTPTTLAPRRLHTPSEYLPPSTPLSLPSNSVVPANTLPYYLTQDEQGSWYRIPNAWSLYGRMASSDPTETQASIPVDSYIVQHSLPTGWGDRNSERSYYYNTPIIVAASVVLGILIVFGIIIYTYHRRKTLRRRKRHAARMRRKALAAAGLTEESLKAADAEHEARFKERLAELEAQHAAKRKVQKKQTNKSIIVRTKVRTWRSGMRRRTPTKTDQEVSSMDKEEVPNGNGGFTTALDLQRRRTSQESLLTRDSVSLATTRSSLSRGPSRSSVHPRQLPQAAAEPTDTSDQGPSGGSTTALESSDSAPRSSSPDSHQPSEEPVQPPVASGSMPPAYRPASVHGVEASSSSSTGASSQTDHVPAVLSADKAAAAGYYTAPATEDAESAQAVSRIADAKAPIAVPPTITEERQQMHVATDDKGELERMRLGASAPPVARADDGQPEDGPSAPSFDVDEAGFERVPEEWAEDADQAGSGSSSRSRHVAAVPGLPEPPALRAMRSPIGDVGESAMAVPSAPPALADPSAPSAPPMPMPSAPPMLDEEHAEPSAPPLDDGDEAEGGGDGDEDEARARELEMERERERERERECHEHDTDGHDEAYHASGSGSGSSRGDSGDSHSLDVSDAGDVRASLNVGGHGFLPRYEP